MPNPFQEHFWRHVWGSWSRPEVMTVTQIDWFGSADTFRAHCQSRTCRVCGKVETRTV